MYKMSIMCSLPEVHKQDCIMGWSYVCLSRQATGWIWTDRKGRKNAEKNTSSE